MLLLEKKNKERKEKQVKNRNKIIQSQKINNNIKSTDSNQYKNYKKEKEESDGEGCIDNSTSVEVIPELQINELFLHWISLPNTQKLLDKYLKKIGIKKEILNNIKNNYFNPYLQKFETSEKKRNELLDIQKFIFSIDIYKSSNIKKHLKNNNNKNNSNISDTKIINNSNSDIDNKFESIIFNTNNKNKENKDIVTLVKTSSRERRKLRKIDSSKNSYINNLSTSLRKENLSDTELKENEIKDNKNISSIKNEIELTESITERNIVNKDSINESITEKTMDNILVEEESKNVLNENLNNEETIQEEKFPLYTKAKKYDSGVDISINSKSTIPRFYFPKGSPLDKNIKKELDEQLNKIELIFKSNSNQLNEQEFWKVTEECELPRYISAALFKKVGGDVDDISQLKISFENFKSVWTEIKSNNFNLDSIIFSILKPNNREKYRGKEDYLIQEDFYIVINDVVQYHPGLEFLSNMPIFQNRYTETVISRLFYSKPRNWNERMTLNEFRKVKFTQKLINLQDEDDDININRDIFSYKHFYVIYCKFWELDKDHDMKINRNELAKYDQFSMTPIMIDRVIEGYGKVTSNDGKILKSGWRDKIDDQKLNSNLPKADNFSSLQEAFRNVSIKNKNLIFGNLLKNYNKEDDPNIMLYKDFIWFILSAEDKGTPQAIEYWFRCLDLDGDGVISVFEIEQFWIEQYQRMIEWRTVDIWSFNDFLCYLLDMIQPENKNIITLADLKRSKNTPLFFDMLFDIKKYEMHLRCMDPLFREANEVWIVEGISSDNINIDEEEKKIKLEGWEKFAERTYEQLAYEEMQAQQYQLSCQNYQMHKGKLVDTNYRHHRNSILDEDPFGPEIIDDFLEEDEEYSICSEDDGEEEMNYTSLDQTNSNLINRNVNFDNYKDIEENTKKLKI